MSNKIAISQFKAHCLEIVQGLQESGQSIIITKRAKPVAELIPIRNTQQSLFGLLQNQGEITGDLLKPIEEHWDAED